MRPARTPQALGDLAEGAGSLLLRIDPTGERGVAIGSAERPGARARGRAAWTWRRSALDAGFLGPKAADWLGALGQGRAGRAARLPPRPAQRLRRGRRQPRADRGAPDRRAPPSARAWPSPTRRRASSWPRAAWCTRPAAARRPSWPSPSPPRSPTPRRWPAPACAIDDAFGRIVLGLAVDADYFLGHRQAARRAHGSGRGSTGACGVDAPARIEARSSGRMLTRADPWTNMIRLTAAGFAAAAGGADAVVLGAFTDALGAPTRLRAAPVAQHPAGADGGGPPRPRRRPGRRRRLPRDAHRRAGAAPPGTASRPSRRPAARSAALESGLVAEAVEETRAELTARLGAKQTRVLGVTDFPAAEGRDAAVETDAPAPPVDAPSPRLPGPDSRCPPLTAIRLEDLRMTQLPRLHPGRASMATAALAPPPPNAAEPWETPEGIAVKPRYGAGRRRRPRLRRRLARASRPFLRGPYPTHVRHQPVDHPSVCGLFHRRGVQRLLSPQPRRRPDGPLGRLRPRHPPRLRLRPSARHRRRRHGRRRHRLRSSTCAPSSPASRSTR